jgi:hypothetical protein
MVLLEVLVGLVVLVAGLGLLSDLIVQVSHTREQNREYALAVAAACNAVEDLHAEDFFEIFALYNMNPDDDPGGPATGPGSFFPVLGLERPDGRPEVGQFIFPAVTPEPTSTHCELREDVENRKLGMPRDLDVDGSVDDADHAADYCVLPFAVEVEWEGRCGKRVYRLYSMLTEMRL